MTQGQLWVLFYAGIVSMQTHPKNERPPDLDSCARLADDMIKRYQERYTWLGHPQSHPSQEKPSGRSSAATVNTKLTAPT